MSRLTCLVVFGNLTVPRNFLIFSDSGDMPSFVITFPKNFIEPVAISHFCGDSFNPDLRIQSKMRVNVGIRSSNDFTAHPMSSMN